jgi:transcriptional regulator with XRE-family HTH domain
MLSPKVKRGFKPPNGCNDIDYKLTGQAIGTIILSMEHAPNLIRHRRKSAKLSQQALANKVGVSKVTISSLEVGRMQLTLDYMKRISRALGLTALDLLIESEQQEFLRTEEIDLIRAYRVAGPLQREIIHRVAKPLGSALA